MTGSRTSHKTENKKEVLKYKLNQHIITIDLLQQEEGVSKSRYTLSVYYTLRTSLSSAYHHAMLIPRFMLALELKGINSLLVLPSRWSIPMKKLYPFG